MAQSLSPPDLRAPADPAQRSSRRIIAAVITLLLTGFAADQARSRFSAWIDATPMPSLTVATGTEVVARDGSLLRTFQVEDGIWRLTPPATGIDQRFLKMLIAWEDQRFAEHYGVDLPAIIRAAFQAIWHGRIVSGASTLSMQTARLLERGPTASWRGKLRQARLALALERRLGKDGILALYLRLAPYGGNTEGVRAASLMWFGKEPTRLTPAESALLVALPQSPEARRPDISTRHENARMARNRVIDHAEAHGIIDTEAADLARKSSLPSERRAFPAHAALLAERLRRENPGMTRIETTIDLQLQKTAEALAARAVLNQSERMSAALIIADHTNGEILAEVGTADYGNTPRDGFVDMTRALRSPGSTLKPFVYALGFDDGLIHPDTLIEDRPAIFGRWQPENFDRHFRGTITIRRALQESLNIPVVRVAEALGPARILAGLHRAGIKVEMQGGQAGLALVLGGAGVSLHDLVAGYAALARHGRAVKLHEIPLPQPGSEAEPVRVTGAAAAWQTGAILSQILPPGGRPAGRVAYKTGTSYGHRDALSVGYDGRFVIGVWMGRADGTPVPGVFGGQVAAPLLFDLFDMLGPRTHPLPPPPADTIIAANPNLPLPLRRFTPPGSSPAPSGPDGQFGTPNDPLIIVFPPDGTELELTSATIPVRLRGGVPPYTWLVNGSPAAIATRDPITQIPGQSGISEITVTDSTGTTRRTRIRMSQP